jgi:hypothetical protein
LGIVFSRGGGGGGGTTIPEKLYLISRESFRGDLVGSLARSGDKFEEKET